MKSWRPTLFAWMLFLLLPLAAWAANVAPLGLEVGVADLATVKNKLGGQTRLREDGINKWTGGPMLKGDGEGLGIDGLQEILFIFDPQRKLQGVVMTMDKGRFGDVRGFLKAKYETVREVVPFVGNAYARYRSGDSIAEIDAPHLSFSMEVRYLSNALLKHYQAASAEEENRRKKAESAKF